MQKKVKLTPFLCESLHIWSLGTKKIHRLMTVFRGLSEGTGAKESHRPGDCLIQILNKDTGWGRGSEPSDPKGPEMLLPCRVRHVTRQHPLKGAKSQSHRMGLSLTC